MVGCNKFMALTIFLKFNGRKAKHHFQKSEFLTRQSDIECLISHFIQNENHGMSRQIYATPALKKKRNTVCKLRFEIIKSPEVPISPHNQFVCGKK